MATCSEVQTGLTEEEKRTLARALNLARRHLSTAAKRQLIADQLAETPGRSNRWVGKQLGVSHPTVASVRAELEATGKIYQFERTVGEDGKQRPARPLRNAFGLETPAAVAHAWFVWERNSRGEPRIGWIR
jgi:hypothetical protein